VNNFQKELLRKYPAMDARKLLRNIGHRFATGYQGFANRGSYLHIN